MASAIGQPLPFDAYRSDEHSQNGEDGVLAELLNRLGISAADASWCVEFGAWDGMHLSNTFALVKKGWKAAYIEGDADRFKTLLETAKRHPEIVPLNAFVSHTAQDKNSLDNLLRDLDLPSDFDVLSIDIDSHDCEVWESLTGFMPKIVVIEINSSIPPGIEKKHSAESPGNSFTSTHEVGRKKGYSLVCHTGNLIFVRDDLAAKLGIDPIFYRRPELLFRPDWLPLSATQRMKSKIVRYGRSLVRPLRCLRRLLSA